jgi:hypothetical protein
LEVVGHLVPVVGFEVVVGPLDDDPPEIAERVVELSRVDSQKESRRDRLILL